MKKENLYIEEYDIPNGYSVSDVLYQTLNGQYRLLKKHDKYVYQVGYHGWYCMRYTTENIPLDVIKIYGSVENWFTINHRKTKKIITSDIEYSIKVTSVSRVERYIHI